LSILPKLREAGINTEMYPDSVKLKKQLDYADRKNIPFVILIGSDEISTGQLTLKNMKTGEQQKGTVEELIAVVQ
jgi:histidyl-tRNA synthetase